MQLYPFCLYAKHTEAVKGKIMTDLDSLKFDQMAIYQIKVKGRLDERWAQWFDGMSITSEPAEDGSTLTVLTGHVVDQAALHGLLSRIRDLGLSLVLVERVEN
jgi:hypothetical protein